MFEISSEFRSANELYTTGFSSFVATILKEIHSHPDSDSDCLYQNKIVSIVLSLNWIFSIQYRGDKVVETIYNSSIDDEM